MSVSPEQMALAAIAQSIYILFSFVIEAQCKGASAIVANLLGAKEHKPLSRVLRSAFSLHFCYFALLFTLVWSFPEAIFALFSSDEGNALQMTPALMVTFKNALICIALFFLVDGFGWILIGFLTAAKDTRYIFWVSILVNWVAYIPPTFWLVGWNKGGADVAWGIIVAVTSLSLLLYFWRYASGKWLERENTSIEDHTTPEIREAPL
jgi:multidrug resistance protein, MATE family